MKTIQYICLAVVLFTCFSCSEDEISSQSVLAETPTPPTKFDQWIYDNYTAPYNINLLYRYEDREAEQNYQIVPAKEDKAFALAQLIRYMWIDSYTELMGSPTFMCKYCPKLITLIGSPCIDVQYGTERLGEAEGGVKITLYKVNDTRPDLLAVSFEDQYAKLNEYFFHTMHHEFGHILHQTIPWPVEFNNVTPGQYSSGSWVNISDSDALQSGFITPYASSATQEDFVETYSIFITSTPEEWEAMMGAAEKSSWSFFDTSDEPDGRALIEKKLSIIDSYLRKSWNMDIYKLRDIVQRRGASLRTLKLEELENL